MIEEKETDYHIRRKKKKTWAIEYRWTEDAVCWYSSDRTWRVWKRYEKASQRDEALLALSQKKHTWIEYRKAKQ